MNSDSRSGNHASVKASDRLSPTVNSWRHSARRRQQTVSDGITRFSGSMSFVLLHVVWFAVWIVLNQAVSRPFDPFPFGLLTLVVSLEAIFLSAFVLISQNRQNTQDEQREAADFKTNVYAEVIAKLVADKLGVSDTDIWQAYDAQMQNARQPRGQQ